MFKTKVSLKNKDKSFFNEIIQGLIRWKGQKHKSIKKTFL